MDLAVRVACTTSRVARRAGRSILSAANSMAKEFAETAVRAGPLMTPPVAPAPRGVSRFPRGPFQCFCC
jgi:hypothetical protein